MIDIDLSKDPRNESFLEFLRKNLFPNFNFSFALLIMLSNIVFDTTWYVKKLIIRDSTVNDIGMMLLSTYLLPFEVVSILLLAALIGAAMLSRKKVD